MISNDIFPLKPSVRVGTCRKYDCACYALFTQGHSYVLCRQMKQRQIPALRGLDEEHGSHLISYTSAYQCEQPKFSSQTDSSSAREFPNYGGPHV